MSCGVELDLDAFGSWLCAHADVVVGSGGMCFASPLARWLSEVSGSVYGVDGGVYGRALWDDCGWLRLPRWAELFTARLEQRAFQALMGHEAFAILAWVEMVCHERGSPVW